MTGEITLRGNVLPVGGIKEKVLAAHRAGIKRVIIPERNKKDLIDVPEEIKKEMEILGVKRMDEVLALVLEPRDRQREGDAVGRLRRRRQGRHAASRRREASRPAAA